MSSGRIFHRLSQR